MRVIERPVMYTAIVPAPEMVADDVMALHTILDLLIAQHFTPTSPLGGVNGLIASEVLPILQHVSEQARRAACNIEHLARGC